MKKVILLLPILMLGVGCQASSVLPNIGGCSKELRFCGDGTMVGRVSPSCEFEACPKGAIPKPGPPQDGVVCTMEAKLCPDGSAVGRTGPNCEFAQCPGRKTEQPQACSEEAKLCPDGSAVGRTGPNCSFAPCPGE